MKTGCYLPPGREQSVERSPATFGGKGAGTGSRGFCSSPRGRRGEGRGERREAKGSSKN